MNIYKNDFPIFRNEKNSGLIYFDNSATTQRPQCVIDAVSDFYKSDNANPIRGLYGLSVRATEAYEGARRIVKDFIGAADEAEIVFTRNTTESINLVAFSYALETLREGDEIALTIMEHHSNILPWQMAAKKTGAKIVWLECDKESGEIPKSEWETKINQKTKIVSVAHVSNVLGTQNPVKEIAAVAHKYGAVVLVDGAQSTPHIKIDVQDIGADFFVFSGHKICAPTGIGVLYAKRGILEKMEPFLRGGEMIEYVTRDEASWAELPYKFEAGTANFGAAVGLGAALKYIEQIGIEKIAAHDARLGALLAERLSEIEHIKIVGNKDGSKRSGIITFTIDGVHPHDIATILDTEKIAVRAGHHCAQPLGQYLDIPATARASLYFYNDEEEVDIFLQKIKNVRKWMGYGN